MIKFWQMGKLTFKPTLNVSEFYSELNKYGKQIKLELDVFNEVGLIEMEQSGNAHIWKLNESWSWLKEYSETLS